MFERRVSEVDDLEGKAYREEPGAIRLEVSTEVDDFRTSDGVE